MFPLPAVGLEDELSDVLGKAMRGLGESIGSLAAKTGLPPSGIESALAGAPDLAALPLIALTLGLEPGALAELAGIPNAPVVELPESIVMLNTPHPVSGYAAMTVNNFLFLPESSPEVAVAFDTGADAEAVHFLLEKSGRRLEQLFLTHTHHDHVAAYAGLAREARDLSVFCPEQEAFGNANRLRHGECLEVAGCVIRVLEIAGHSPGGLIYLLDGLTVPVAIVGDAIFCRSIGKVGPDLYRESLHKLRAILNALPDATLLCPGHGPVTTVAFEKRHNPFVARAKS